jgi:hypothetical protein
MLKGMNQGKHEKHGLSPVRRLSVTSVLSVVESGGFAAWSARQ